MCLIHICHKRALMYDRDLCTVVVLCLFFFQAEDGIRDLTVTGVQTCALPIFAGFLLPFTPLLLSFARLLFALAAFLFVFLSTLRVLEDVSGGRSNRRDPRRSRARGRQQQRRDSDPNQICSPHYLSLGHALFLSLFVGLC